MTKEFEYTPPEGYSLQENWGDVEYALAWFQSSMDAKMALNAHKGHWHHVTFVYLCSRITEETMELGRALEARDHEAIIDECVDLANCAMMLADWFRLHYSGEEDDEDA